ncbi:HAD-IIB family hydrolase [Galbitalea sp. SE-J8]|uniref:HAD-IIB family hydrolase n=1 Tax=Galbitalea sp. SE-J8 TaxID=3054952 RepID=UPI00259C8727|nr:HAD-IIB family hydrolase [Galbitalea sp. SE-J8]MDM4763867.1 HAD-IIB family hydrolase [Galbitalea sp. SE-J8]
MTEYRLIAFDLDDTLAPSKSAMDASMVPVFAGLLERFEVCVISGGQIGQFRSQFLSSLGEVPDALLARLHLMPTCGTQYFRFVGGDWSRIYAEDLTTDERERALAALKSGALSLGLWETTTWGPALEDRGSQITYSALGQEAPLDAKKAWDPTGAKKNALREKVQAELPDLEVRSGGSTSIDITRKGIDKAYGMRKLVELAGVPLDEMLFIGDRLDPDGNDYPVKALGVATRPVEGWQDTRSAIIELLS